MREERFAELQWLLLVSRPHPTCKGVAQIAVGGLSMANRNNIVERGRGCGSIRLEWNVIKWQLRGLKIYNKTYYIIDEVKNVVSKYIWTYIGVVIDYR